ncbi:phytanoyl-CoA dioxygenase family protein [Streptomyces sp. SID5770]|uniref:phytanoyl-CoA dioxygenase family protein n=1 Tax=Streptomyces sp. SID5770 TaxID=2690308 RepID=UPI00136CDC49|nr:phytanoyl-CoA dioxygenase family protein [Streptomyces sp. SID5770]MZE55780.1 phytanoyl-CoA dioxygenase family protein [Streptomyces sp. SID5770]
MQDISTTTTDPQRERTYRDRGYVIAPGLITPDETAMLRHEAGRIGRGELGGIEGLTPAAEDATDDEASRQFLCVHFPHKTSSVFRSFLAHPKIVAILTELVGPDVKAMQSMLFTKAEGRPGQAWHQDEFWIPTRDRSLTGVWIALDDATVENGCLWALPGSHRRGVLYPDREHEDERFDCTVESYGFPYRDSDAVPLEVEAGDVVFFNGYLLHRSLPNTGRHGMRRALVNHYMNANSVLPWQTVPAGTHVGKWDYRDIVLVAGEDPYAYRGTPDLSTPMVRPEREGGCHR